MSPDKIKTFRSPGVGGYDDARRMNAAKTKARRFRSSATWQTISRRFRARWAYCCDPLNRHPQRLEPAAEVHHIVPLVEDYGRRSDPLNLATVCHGCHDQIERTERQFPGTTRRRTREAMGALRKRLAATRGN